MLSININPRTCFSDKSPSSENKKVQLVLKEDMKAKRGVEV
jgi:hypothetical protein